MACNPDNPKETLRNSRRHLQGEYGLRRYLRKVAFAVLTLFGSMAVATALIGTSMGLNFLMGLAFGQGSQLYQLFRLFSSVFLVGAGLMIAAGGSIVAVLETVASLYDYGRLLLGQDEADV